jgi:hypothetical protein
MPAGQSVERPFFVAFGPPSGEAMTYKHQCRSGRMLFDNRELACLRPRGPSRVLEDQGREGVTIMQGREDQVVHLRMRDPLARAEASPGETRVSSGEA